MNAAGGRWRRYRYLNALIWYLVLLGVEPFFLKDGETPFGPLVFIVVVLSCIWASATTKARTISLCLLGIPCFLGAFFPGRFEALAKAGSTLFFVVCAVLVLKDLWRDEEVELDTLFGSILGLLLAAGTFAFLFAAVEEAMPGSFKLGDYEEHRKGWEILPFFYFSLVNISTLGYGDIVPLTPGARNLAGFEAIFGQFYFASLVARLVTRHSGPSED